MLHTVFKIGVQIALEWVQSNTDKQGLLKFGLHKRNISHLFVIFIVSATHLHK